MKSVSRVDKAGSIGEVSRQDGMLRVPARLTRVGVFKYQKPDGSEWREYRPAEEVFKADSLATYAGRPLMVGHRLDAVNANSWRDVAVGDVRDDVRKDGDFVAATVQINDARTVSKVDTGELVELSCGYKCSLELTKGTYNGESYDAIQRNITLNHVALLAPNRGRAGRDVRLLLDSDDNALVEDPGVSSLSLEMADNEEVAKVQKERNDALDQIADLKRKLDEANGKVSAASALADKARLDAQTVVSGLDSKVQARVMLLEQARKVLPELRADGKSDLEVKKEVISKLSPATKLDGVTEDFVNGVYSTLVANYDGGRREAEEAINRAPSQRADEAQKAKLNPVEEAHERMLKRNGSLWQMSDKQLRKLANKGSN